MRVGQIGEFGLIGRISAMLAERAPGVVTGIGDDVAVLDTSGPEYLLATCDIQVEGVHFTRDAMTPYQLGRKLVAINVSDIAAMGGDPRWALVSLAIPGDTEVAYVEELYRGMREQAALAGASIVGGNLSHMKSSIVLDLTLLGVIAPERLVLRSTARAGDAILLTGSPGESRAGLELIRRPELALSPEIRQKLLEKHLCPQPRLAEGRLLARSGQVNAMIDVSDGVIADLSHICKSSGKGAEIVVAGLPVSRGLPRRPGWRRRIRWNGFCRAAKTTNFYLRPAPNLFPISKKCYWMRPGVHARKSEKSLPKPVSCGSCLPMESGLPRPQKGGTISRKTNEERFRFWDKR